MLVDMAKRLGWNKGYLKDGEDVQLCFQVACYRILSGLRLFR
ncbi:hypothetical protein EIKCOROL_01931 [Eikenella corrodens ATCC 23834]|uniref:Uncharacterized protein n=1 Tax=Eikenella corrodens ATCC 23834 TaxID=546274 RepID=C0DX27_EIKCO|nr:hypothetical protein EIKCOROL_01931 [Eikenella corrodens ATCC 23834]